MATATNKKVMYTAQQQAAFLEEQADLAPAPGEVVGKTLASVISSGSEIGGYMNYYGGTAYPCPTGYAAVLQVLAVGAGVSRVKAGDIVFAQTPHQLYSRFEEAEAVPVPQGMKPQHAVLGRFPAISMTTMLKTAVRPTEPVIVTGLGIVGLCCAQMMLRCGYPVYAVDPSAARRETAEECGVVNTAANLAELEHLKGICGLGIECSGSDAASMGLVGHVRKGGEVSLVGVPWRSTDPSAVNTLLRNIFGGFVTVYSGWEWSLPLHEAPFFPNSNFKSFATAMQWIKNGDIKVDGIYELCSPASCAEIYDSLSKGQTAKTCVIFDWTLVE